jgi:acyl carrier protein
MLDFPPENRQTKPTMQVSPDELKVKIIESLNLQDVTPDQIDNDAPLFGAGLELDSIDALELVVMLEKNYGIVIKDIEEGRPAFQSVRVLADFIAARRPS